MASTDTLPTSGLVLLVVPRVPVTILLAEMTLACLNGPGGKRAKS